MKDDQFSDTSFKSDDDIDENAKFNVRKSMLLNMRVNH
jgi:hypothetical protein